MKILALETSTLTRSAAVLDGEKLLSEITISGDRKHSESFVSAVKQLLESLELKPADLEAYAVGMGPGSFTGLRIGLSLIKGLHLAHPRPTIGVSTLHALAQAARSMSGLILPLLDAHRGEVYTARFRGHGAGTLMQESAEAAMIPRDLAAAISEPAIVLGDALYKYRAELEPALPPGSVILPELHWAPRAAWVGVLAAARLLRGESDPPETLAPIYVRNTNQELLLDRG